MTLQVEPVEFKKMQITVGEQSDPKSWWFIDVYIAK